MKSEETEYPNYHNKRSRFILRKQLMECEFMKINNCRTLLINSHPYSEVCDILWVMGANPVFYLLKSVAPHSGHIPLLLRHGL